MSVSEEELERRRRDAAALERVQRRVAACVFLGITVHGVIALPIVAGVMRSNGEEGNAIGMVIMTGVISLITVIVARLILGHRPLAPLWLLLGTLPFFVAVWYVWHAPFTIH